MSIGRSLLRFSLRCLLSRSPPLRCVVSTTSTTVLPGLVWNMTQTLGNMQKTDAYRVFSFRTVQDLQPRRFSVVSCVSAQLSWDGRFLYTLHTKTGFQGDESTIKVGQGFRWLSLAWQTALRFRLAIDFCRAVSCAVPQVFAVDPATAWLTEVQVSPSISLITVHAPSPRAER